MALLLRLVVPTVLSAPQRLALFILFEAFVEAAAITLAMRLVRRLIFLHLPLRMVVLLKQRSIARPKIENVFCCCRPVEIAASLDLMRQSGAAKQV
jgi:hypothetical protein